MWTRGRRLTVKPSTPVGEGQRTGESSALDHYLGLRRSSSPGYVSGLGEMEQLQSLLEGEGPVHLEDQQPGVERDLPLLVVKVQGEESFRFVSPFVSKP